MGGRLVPGFVQGLIRGPHHAVAEGGAVLVGLVSWGTHTLCSLSEDKCHAFGGESIDSEGVLLCGGPWPASLIRGHLSRDRALSRSQPAGASEGAFPQGVGRS